MIAMAGLCEAIKQPSTVDAAMNPQEVMQVAQLFKSREQKFKERKKYLLDKLKRIRAEVQAEDGGAFYDFMEKYMASGIRNSRQYGDVSNLELIDKLIKGDRGKKTLFFYQYNIRDICEKKRGEYTYIPDICAARGEVWCEPTVGLYVCIIDPSIPKKRTINGVAVPKADENMGIMRIPVKYTSNALGCEKSKGNIIVYENAMKYVYKFFEGEISKEQLDAVATELVDKGKDDLTAYNLYKKTRDSGLSKEETGKILIQAQKAKCFPDIKTKTKFNGKNYTISYDNGWGYIIIEFPLD